MASGRPILLGSHGGEAVRELEKAGGALTFSARDPEQLAAVIRALYHKEIDGEGLGKKYHEYVKRYHTREIWAQKYLDLIGKINGS